MIPIPISWPPKKTPNNAKNLRCSPTSELRRRFFSNLSNHLRREAPMPPLEGEVVERQRNRRGLSVNRAVQRNPSVSPFGLPAPLSGEPRRLRRSGRLRASPSVTYTIHRTAHSHSLRADSIRPYGLSREAGSGQPVRADSSTREPRAAKAALHGNVYSSALRLTALYPPKIPASRCSRNW